MKKLATRLMMMAYEYTKSVTLESTPFDEVQKIDHAYIAGFRAAREMAAEYILMVELGQIRLPQGRAVNEAIRKLGEDELPEK